MNLLSGRLKYKVEFIYFFYYFLMLYFLLIFILIGCSGSSWGTKANKSMDEKNEIITSVSNKIILAEKSSSPDTTIYEAIKLLPSNQNTVDEFNVRTQILEFRNPKTGKLLKTRNLIQENPFHEKDFIRSKEPFPSINYFLMKNGTKNKFDLKEFLPKAIFEDIPLDFKFERAISRVLISRTLQKFVTVSYELDWLPDAYSDEGEWDGPGFGVHLVVVYDSLGNNICNRQFDGTSVRPSISEDGKYLFTMACLSPEWDKNIKYRFSIVSIKTNKVVFEELIENCKKDGGSGDFYSEGRNNKIRCNPYNITKADDTGKIYLYYNSQFFFHEDKNHIYQWYFLENEQIKVIYRNGQSAVVDFNLFFNPLTFRNNEEE